MSKVGQKFARYLKMLVPKQTNFKVDTFEALRSFASLAPSVLPKSLECFALVVRRDMSEQPGQTIVCRTLVEQVFRTEAPN